MQQSKRNGGFPLWLFCIFLFALLVAFFVIRIPRIMESRTPEPSTELTIETEVSATSPEDTKIAEAESDAASAAPDAVNAVSVDGETDDGATLIIAEPPSEPTPEKPEVHIHSYCNGICSECGAKPEFVTDFLPAEFYQQIDHAGTVQKYNYTTKAYVGTELTYDKSLCVYIPYDYDPAHPYDVLVLVHGAGGDEDSWLNTVYDYGDIQMCGRVILDNIFDRGLARPCLVVCPVTEIPLCQGLTSGILQLQDELREVILPYIAENYSTYAKDGSIESLREARDHFGLGGLSNGALFVYEGGMRHDFDLFSSFMALSGNGEPWKTVGIIQDNEFKDLPIRCLFTGAGTYNDWQQNYTEIGYTYFLENEPRVADGKNAWRVDVEGEHEWKVWFTDLYNALPLMFQETD